MSQPNFAQITADLELRYTGTFVRYREDDSKPFETYLIIAIQGKLEDYPDFVMQGIKGSCVASYKGRGEFNFKLPQTGYFSYKEVGYLSYYKPSRQNKRSLCPSTNIRGNFYTNNRMIPGCALDIHVANAIYNPTYPTVEEALHTLNNRRKYCVPLNQEYALGLSITSNPNHILFHYVSPIAEVGSDGAIKAVSHPSLERLAHASPVAGF
jgi:hypothetical protein